MNTVRICLSILLALLAVPAEVAAACRQALALGLDVSGSVNGEEYSLQMRGLANALRHPDVAAALLATPSAPVVIAVFEWSAPEYQRLLVDWTAIIDSATLDTLARQLDNTPRAPAPPVTGLGQAMLFGAGLLERRRDCWKRTLDISGDGRSNSGLAPDVVRAGLQSTHDITLNGLVIGSDAPHGGDLRQVEIGELSSYYRAYVIFGPDAFVETALGFEDYEAAMVRKLKRELEGLAVSTLSPVQERP